MYGGVQGLFWGSEMFVGHYVSVQYIYGYHGPGGTMGAGVTYFVLSVVGGCIGTRLAGLRPVFLRCPVTRRQLLGWIIVFGAAVGYWLALYHFPAEIGIVHLFC